MKIKGAWMWAVVACGASLFALSSSYAESLAFKVDASWPKPLPNNWILGQVGGMAVDAQDNIWVFQRPRSLTEDEKGAALTPPRSKCCVPAPSVLVFNQAGDVVKAWGGPGENLGYDWPAVEHGILVDNKGFVWLTGSGKDDGMVLKFTTDGKFVKQLGKRGPLTSSKDLTQFGQAAALALDAPANEMYVADGYGNHRVAVFDTETGAIKRIWGAYGKPPTDDNVTGANPELAAVRQSGALRHARQGWPRLCLRPQEQSGADLPQGRQLRAAVRVRRQDARLRLVVGRCVFSARPGPELFRADRRDQQ